MKPHLSAVPAALLRPKEASRVAPAIRPGRPQAAAAVWDWRGERPPGQAAPTAWHLRREGLIRALAGAALGAAAFLFWHRTPAYVVWAVSALTLFLALTSPAGAYAALGRGLAAFGRLVGRVLAVVLLTPVFLLFFLPFRLLLRSGRRDRLERFFDREAPTYWKRRQDPERTRAFYERQF
jgi:hypothetical protein